MLPGESESGGGGCGQLVHGASSSGSRLNRQKLCYDLAMLQVLVIIHIATEHGCGGDWSELWYPPVP